MAAPERFKGSEMTAEIVSLGRDPVLRQADHELANVRRRLKELRIAKGWSTKDLADRIGLPDTYFENIESGKTVPGLMTVLVIASHLGCSLRNLAE